MKNFLYNVKLGLDLNLSCSYHYNPLCYDSSFNPYKCHLNRRFYLKKKDDINKSKMFERFSIKPSKVKIL